MDRYLNHLADGATIVTATQRLTRAIVAEHDRRQREAGAEVWARPDVLPLDAFVARAYDDLVHAGALGTAPRSPLPASAELALWEQLVSSTAGEEHPLLDVAATARAARTAWGLTKEWELPLPRGRWLLGDDQQAFVGWAGEFDRACERLGVLDAARLPEAVARAWEDGAPPPAGPVTWAGFDERTPRRRRLDAALRCAGVDTAELEDPTPAGRVARVALPAVEDELCAFAAWARTRLERAPAARIGLVLPDVAGVRGLVDRALGDALQPRRALDPRGEHPKPWNVSIGPNLADYPMIAAALDVLRLAQGRPAAALAGSVIRSPYFGGAEAERAARARLDGRLRELGEPRFSLERLRRGPARSSCPELVRRLGEIQEQRIPPRVREAPSRWAERFSRCLDAAGWPGDRTLSSEEYQLLERWRGLLDELSGLDLVSPALDAAEALERLTEAAAREVFQPRTPEAPVQVVGVLEAAGLAFDALWVAGLHDEAWPPPARPNPFLPLALQREHDLPGSSPGRTARWARLVTDRLLRSAREVVLSAPRLEGERELRPSPLLEGYREVEPWDLVEMPSRRLPDRLRRAAALETVPDGRGPAIPAGEMVRGGTSLFTDQAACPFRGFAHHRLRARGLEEHGRGVDARVRGSLVHGTLERLWAELGDAETLHGADDEVLGRRLEACARDAVAEEARFRPESMSARFVELEVARLVAAVGALLAWERERTPFAVERRESEEMLQVGGVQVAVRLDRVDRLAGGGLAVLDYKAGRAEPPAWFDERLEQPQLPLYATGMGSDRVDAVALVHVRPDGAKLQGVARSEGLLPGIGAFVDSKHVERFGEFDGLLAQWREWLERLAGEIRAGAAEVAPKQPPQTCRHCDLRALCRVDERLGWHPHDAAAPDEGGDGEPGGDGE